MTTAPLAVERVGSTTTLVLARPEKRNALSAALVDALIDAVGDTREANVLAIRGEGRCLSAGFDFTDVERESAGDLLLRFVRIEALLQDVAAAPSLTIGFAHGRNFGAGVDLFAVCRRRIAAPDATFRMPGLMFGLVLGTRRFADLVGTARARAILQEARTFDAAEAQAIGFVDEVVPVADWPARLDVAGASAAALAPADRAALHAALHAGHEDADLARLVRSAARPGLKERIARYLAAS